MHPRREDTADQPFQCPHNLRGESPRGCTCFAPGHDAQPRDTIIPQNRQRLLHSCSTGPEPVSKLPFGVEGPLNHEGNYLIYCDILLSLQRWNAVKSGFETGSRHLPAPAASACRNSPAQQDGSPRPDPRPSYPARQAYSTSAPPGTRPPRRAVPFVCDGVAGKGKCGAGDRCSSTVMGVPFTMWHGCRAAEEGCATCNAGPAPSG